MAGDAAARVVDGVIDVAAPAGLTATGESTVLVASAEEPGEGGAGTVAVDGENAAGDRRRHHALPGRRAGDEDARGVGVDRPVAGKPCGFVRGAGHREHGNGDLHGGQDRGQPRSRDAVVGPGGEQHVGGDVGLELVHRADIRGLAVTVCATVARTVDRNWLVGFTGVGGAGCDDGVRLRREPVVDAVDDDSLVSEGECGHDVGQVDHPHIPGGYRIRVPLVE
ncbi:hypothetical protein [Microbacterium sp. CPCC 204701]|uniref:hypothetical protein n=1 Tax=Microbacterium sp. CPCC 204701 TaxID=2493084 RepID=UPI000FDB4FDE|nr:hypothetical protein [Microbacterium sp. CPCC 204701]